MNEFETGKSAENTAECLTDQSKYDRADVIMAFAALLFGVFVAVGKPVQYLGITMTICCIVFLAALLVYLKAVGRSIDGGTKACIALCAVDSLPFVLFENDVLKALNLLFFAITATYLVRRAFGKPKKTWLGTMPAAIGGAVVNLQAMFASVFSRVRGEKKKSTLTALAGLAVALPVFAIVASLLISSDDAFGWLVGSAAEWLINAEVLFRTVFAVMVASVIASMMYSSRMRSITQENDLSEVKGLAPERAAVWMMIPFVGLYFVYFATQLLYFSGKVSGEWGGTTPAEYARNGFFELCAVVVINFCVIAGSWLCAKKEEREKRGLRVMYLLIGIATTALIILAMCKMVMYVDIFGLTQLRLYVMWFLVFLFCICIFALLKFVNRGFLILRAVTVTGIVMFLLLQFGCTDRLIAEYNVYAYDNGWIATLDVGAICETSSAAMPVANRLDDEKLDEGQKEIIDYYNASYFQYEQNWRDFNIEDAFARQNFVNSKH